jgi:hypothetical protein
VADTVRSTHSDPGWRGSSGWRLRLSCNNKFEPNHRRLPSAQFSFHLRFHMASSDCGECMGQTLWLGFIILCLFIWFGLVSLQGSVFDTDAYPGFVLLGALISLPITLILSFLAAYLLYVLCLAIGRLLRVPSDLLYHYRRFREKWTLPSRRFGWRSLPGFPDPKVPLLLETGCSHECQSTSKLCQECYHIIERSRLISGSFAPFTRRVEWYKWVVPVQGSAFRTSRVSCHLCHVLWYSLDEQERLKLAGPYTPRRQLPDAPPWLWLSIWEDENSGWLKTGCRYLSLYGGDASQPENRRSLCKSIEIREGL